MSTPHKVEAKESSRIYGFFRAVLRRVLRQVGDWGRFFVSPRGGESHLRSEKPTDRVFRPVVETLNQALGLPTCIWLIDETDTERKTLRIAAAVGLSDAYTRAAFLRLDEPAVASDVFATGQAQVVPDIAVDPHWKYKDEALAMGLRSAIVAPLRVKQKIVGVLDVYTRELRSFAPFEKTLIEGFAAQVAATQRYLASMSRLNEVSLLIGSELQLDALFKNIMRSAQTVLECQHVSLFLVEKSGDIVLKAVSAEGIARERFAPGEGLAGWVAKEGKTALVHDAANDPRFIAGISSTVTERSLLVVPIIEEGRVLGVLSADMDGLRGFDEFDQSLLETLAKKAAVAISNARLFQQRATVAEIARDITSVLDRDVVLQKTLERALTLLGCEVGSIALPNPITGELEHHYAIGREVGTRLPVGKGLMSAAAQTRAPVRVDDVTKNSRYVEHVKETRSELAVPLLVGNELVGVLDLQSSRLAAFTEDDEQAAIAVASQAAIALHNARVFQEHLNDLKALQSVDEAISKEPLAKILQLVTEHAVRLTPSQYGNLWLMDSATKELRFGFEVNLLDKPTKRPDWIRLDERSINTWVAITGEPYLCNDVTVDEHYQKINEGVHSELTVPLRRGDRIVGTLNVESTMRAAFTKDHQRLLEALATQAAIAIDNARLYDRLNTLVRVSEAATSTFELDQVLGRVLEESMKAVGATYGTLRLVDRTKGEKGELALRAHRGGIGSRTRENIPVGEGITGWVAEHEKPLLVGDVEKDERYLKYKEDTRCELAVPIKVGDRTIGVLNVEHPKAFAFDDEDVRLLEAIALQVGAAIRNAHLYEATRSVNEMGKTLTAGIRLREAKVLELIRDQASKLMNTDDMYIALYDQATDTVRFGLAFIEGGRIDVTTAEGWQPRKAGKGRTEEIIRTKKPIFTATKAESEAWYAQPEHKEYVGATFASWLGVPMMVGEKVLGVIATYHPTQDYVYSSDDLEILQAMANQAAIALDNSHLFYDVNRRLEALVYFGQAVTSGIRLREDEVLNLIYEQASRLMDANNMYIALYDELTDTVRFGLGFVDGKPIDVKTEKGWEPRKAGKGRTEEIIRTKKPIFTATKAESEAWYAQPEHKEYIGGGIWASWLGVPMMVGEKVLGVIATYHPTQDYVYSSDDLEILQAMANTAAIAIDNARLYEEARKEVIAQKQLATLGTAMAALQHRINNSFNIIVPNVSRLRSRVDTKDATITEILDIIERNARYTSKIISRIQEPLREVESQGVNLNGVLTDIASEIKEQWETDSSNPPVDLILNLDDSIPLIQVPIGQVSEVFRNLTENGYRAMKKSGGRLEVVSQYIDDKIEVRVKDTGTGIPASVQQRLFVKPVPAKEPEGGSGLGLWLSQLMLQRISGEIKIEKSDSSGTTMLVRLMPSGYSA